MKITSSTSSTSTSGVMLICACSCRIDWSSNPMSHLPFRLRWPPRYARSREGRSEEHTSELQSLIRISYAAFCLKTKQKHTQLTSTRYIQSMQHTPTERQTTHL